MNKQSLQELRDKVAAGELGARKWTPKELMVMQRALGPCPENARKAIEGSLDAAVAFLEAVLPGWDWEVSSGPEAIVKDMGSKEPVTIYEAEADTPARALLLATLEALISGESDGVK